MLDRDDFSVSLEQGWVWAVRSCVNKFAKLWE